MCRLDHFFVIFSVYVSFVMIFSSFCFIIKKKTVDSSSELSRVYLVLYSNLFGVITIYTVA